MSRKFSRYNISILDYEFENRNIIITYKAKEEYYFVEENKKTRSRFGNIILFRK